MRLTDTTPLDASRLSSRCTAPDPEPVWCIPTGVADHPGAIDLITIRFMHMAVDPECCAVAFHKLLQIAGEGRGQQVASIYSFPDNVFVGWESFPASCRQRIADLRQNVFLKLYSKDVPTRRREHGQ